MFISLSQIKQSLHRLEPCHPFFGITFLSCKRSSLPIGSTISISLDNEDAKILDEYYKPDPNSDYYYRVFRPSDKQKTWVQSRYHSGSLQTIRTRGQFSNAFIHPKRTGFWGWKPDYLEILEASLTNAKKTPLFDLAVWIHRDRNWPENTTLQTLLETFITDFNLTSDEVRTLYDTAIPSDIVVAEVFQEELVDWAALQTVVGRPPDAPSEEGGTLAYLELRGIGPATQLAIEPAKHLTLLTGDNGLGKTFLLDCAWWALTGRWTDLPAYPRFPQSKRDTESSITFKITNETTGSEPISIRYDRETRNWATPRERPTIPGLVIYAQVDGSFAVWDPARHFHPIAAAPFGSQQPGAFVFTRDQVWNGYDAPIGPGGRTVTYINGLIRDWVAWQNSPKRYPFETLKKVLRRLSPPAESDLGELTPGEPVRLPYDTRDIPTLKHPYGIVPITYAAAGVQRIITIAYLIVWAWYEHSIQSEQMDRPPQRRIVILVDEIEAHLHPQWQRRILPALVDVSKDLDREPEVQFIVATHSPLVTASIEPLFDSEVDKLVHLDLARNSLLTQEVVVKELPFVKHGVVDAWLMSDVFELKHPRSLEAEAAIEDAKRLQTSEDPDKQDIMAVSERLSRYLAAEDEFWPRWTFFAEQRGLNL